MWRRLIPILGQINSLVPPCLQLLFRRARHVPCFRSSQVNEKHMNGLTWEDDMANQLDFFRNAAWLSPTREFRRMQSAVDRLLADLVTPHEALLKKAESFQPSCEIAENEQAFVITFDMPGMNKDQIKLEITDGILTVSAERREEKKDSDKKHVSEVFYGSYTRSFTLPTSVRESEIQAGYEKGVLTVRLPKSEPSKAKRIAVG